MPRNRRRSHQRRDRSIAKLSEWQGIESAAFGLVRIPSENAGKAIRDMPIDQLKIPLQSPFATRRGREGHATVICRPFLAFCFSILPLMRGRGFNCDALEIETERGELPLGFV